MDTGSEFQEESASQLCSDNIKCGTGVFECNICFDLARDPIVTICGHLFCWPCLYKWLKFHSYCHECPVCKSVIDDKNLVPIYGRGTSSSDLRVNPLFIDEIPSRPAGKRPRTAPAPDPSYFLQDGSVAPEGFMPMATAWRGGLTTNALVDAISYVLNLRDHDVRGTSSYGSTRGVDHVLLSYAHGGHAHGFHRYPSHVRATRIVLLMMFIFFIGVVIVLLFIASFLFRY